MSFSPKQAYIVTGPTGCGVGYYTALSLAKHATVILVGRWKDSVDNVKREIVAAGGEAVAVICDLLEGGSVSSAAQEIIAFDFELVGLVNNAAINTPNVSENIRGWDHVWATNHMGPFLLTALLEPHLAQGANVVFLVSSAEDPDDPIGKMSGFKGARYISAEASARGEWLSPGGSATAGYDAYATSKQANLVTCLAFAREYPHIRFNAVDPGVLPGSGLKRDMPLALRLVADHVLHYLAPLVSGWSTPHRAAQVVVRAVLNEGGKTGLYYNYRGKVVKPSAQASSVEFQDRVVRETTALLAKVPT